MLDENPFFRENKENEQEEEKKDDKAIEAEKAITQEAVKIQLNTIYNELTTEYD